MAEALATAAMGRVDIEIVLACVGNAAMDSKLAVQASKVRFNFRDDILFS